MGDDGVREADMKNEKWKVEMMEGNKAQEKYLDKKDGEVDKERNVKPKPEVIFLFVWFLNQLLSAAAE